MIEYDELDARLRAAERQRLIDCNAAVDLVAFGMEAHADSVGSLDRISQQDLTIRLLTRQANREEGAAMHSCGVLADVCDALFDDPQRTETCGYDGVLEEATRLRSLVTTLAAGSVDAVRELATLLQASRGRERDQAVLLRACRTWLPVVRDLGIDPADRATVAALIAELPGGDE